MTLLAVVTSAWANGGPVDSNDPTAAGNLSPRAVDDIRLVSEVLSITLGDDLESYRAQAIYHLHNDEGEHHVHLVIRRDDTYVGLVSELVGVPFAFWPRETGEGVHQTDARISADCASTVIYGRRRLGEAIPYVAPRGLARFTDPVPPGEATTGDVLDFGFQVALLALDNPPLGVVDVGDHILHTYHERVEETVFGALPYRDRRYTVRRWRSSGPLE